MRDSSGIRLDISGIRLPDPRLGISLNTSGIRLPSYELPAIIVFHGIRAEKSPISTFKIQIQ